MKGQIYWDDPFAPLSAELFEPCHCTKGHDAVGQGGAGKVRVEQSGEGQCVHADECTGHGEASDWQPIGLQSGIFAVNFNTSEGC